MRLSFGYAGVAQTGKSDQGMVFLPDHRACPGKTFFQRHLEESVGSKEQRYMYRNKAEIPAAAGMVDQWQVATLSVLE